MPEACAGSAVYAVAGGSRCRPLVVYGRRDHTHAEDVVGRICHHPERYGDRVESSYVDDAAQFLTDAPVVVADLAIVWFQATAWKVLARA